jgi:midasin (ATPase involved in ribosome maturation)
VLLDELNLASQSVLEGLNSCLDHRAEIFIPELGQTFVCPPTFRIFAAQNPLQQGGGRKGLPKSFLNRFTTVRVEELSHADLTFIAASSYPEITPDQISSMVSFNQVFCTPSPPSCLHSAHIHQVGCVCVHHHPLLASSASGRKASQLHVSD